MPVVLPNIVLILFYAGCSLGNPPNPHSVHLCSLPSLCPTANMDVVSDQLSSLESFEGHGLSLPTLP